jgi:elongation factor Ts
MADISAADIKRLRELTGAGMSDCKAALVAADGDVEAAVEDLRKRGLRGVTKREGRTAANGVVTAQVVDGTWGALLEVNCETDFVAKGERFGRLAADVLEQVVARRPADVTDLLEGPATAGSGTVRDQVDEVGAALGEKIEIRRFAIVEAPHVASYLHRTSPDLPPTIGVLVGFDGPAADAGREVAQHIAAFAPLFLERADVPEATVASERRIAEEVARGEGKPEAALPKIVEGRLNGYFKDVVLAEQAFVRDAKRTVGQVLADAGVHVTQFVRYRVGQP